MPKLKTKSRKQWKKEADSVFSFWIRMRGAWEQGGIFWNRCISCGVAYPVRTLQNGHYMSRLHLATRYDELNCHPQDASCNIFRHGNYPNYTIALEKKYGAGIVQELKERSSKIVSLGIEDYKNIIQKYTITDSND